MKKELKFKETKCPKDNLILLHKNCDNCGAPLYLNKETNTCKCEYCDTEYYVKESYINGIVTNDVMGQIIRIKVFGVERQFYIGSITANSIDYCDTFRLLDGTQTCITRNPKLEMELIEI